MYCIYRSQPEISLEWAKPRCLARPEGSNLAWRERICFIWPGTVMSCMAGNSNVLYGWRQLCLVGPEITVDYHTG